VQQTSDYGISSLAHEVKLPARAGSIEEEVSHGVYTFP
jgi:hypothetical protein